ncbi:MAG TPA: hypothetical protein VMU84_03525 [Thermoanaerobaculia bacterium]|nr:hypothetical protein [Thermoanaerobaculia bacterium]
MRLRWIAALLLLISTAAFAENWSYVYARGNVMHASSVRLSSLEKMSKRFGHEFLWTRIGGREYVIRDAATLAETRDLLTPMETTGPQQEALTRRMQKLERRENELEEQIEEREDREDRQSPALERELREVEHQLRVLEAEEERLDAEQDAREQAAEARLKRLIERAIRSGIAVAP